MNISFIPRIFKPLVILRPGDHGNYDDELFLWYGCPAKGV